MGKLIKFLVGLVVAIVLLVVVAIVVLPMVVDPNDYKDEMVAEVKKATGRDLTIGGDLGLSVFPWLGLELNDLDLGNAPGFGETPFAAVKHAQVRARLIPLLSKRLEVETVHIEGLRLNLGRDKNGKGNWEGLVTGPGGPAETPEGTGKKEAGAGGLAALSVGGIEVTDARVVWDDRQQGQRVSIRSLSLSTGPIAPAKPVDLKLYFKVDNAEPAVKAAVRLTATLILGEGEDRLRVAPFRLELEDLETDAGIAANGALTAVLDLDLKAQRYRLNGLRLDARAKGEALPGGALDAAVVGELLVDLAAGTLDLSGLEVTADTLRLTGNAKGSAIRSQPDYSGELRLAELSPREWLKKLGATVPPTADPEVLKKMAFTSRWRYRQERAEFDQLKLALDQTHLTGTAKILLARTPGYRFNLNLDAIDLDRYLPPAGAAQGKKTAKATAAAPEGGTQPGAAGQQPLFPVERIRALDVDGTFTVGELTVNRIKLREAVLELKSQDGRLHLEHQVKRFYQGRLGGDFDLDVRGQVPQLKTAQQVRNVRAGPLVQDLSGQDQFDGTGNFNIAVAADGNSVDALKRTLDGHLDLAFADGAVKGIDLGRMLREAKARLDGKPLPKETGPDQTDFTELKASATIRNGVLDNRDLSAKSPLLRVTGEGTVNLVDETLDYHVQPVIVASAKGQGGEELKELKGIKVPIHLTGSLAKPDWRIEIEKALTASAKAKLKARADKEKQKALNKVEEKLQKELGVKGGLEGLKGLFGK